LDVHFPIRGKKPRVAFRLKDFRSLCRMRKLTLLTGAVWIIVSALLLATCILAGAGASAQDSAPTAAAPAQEPATPAPASTYTPKFRGDPARSDSEAAALAYVRVVMRAEAGFNKQYGHYALTLAQLVHSGTFTQRMLNPERGDYTVGYKGKKDNFMLSMTPKNLDPQHRSFYVENDGKIHADETKAADGDSPIVETHHF
jgi:hypothetical protein